MDIDSPKSPAGRKQAAARKQPASPNATQPLSPTSPSAADAAALALAQAADRSGEASTSGRELVPLPDQLQEAVEAAMASGGYPWGWLLGIKCCPLNRQWNWWFSATECLLGWPRAKASHAHLAHWPCSRCPCCLLAPADQLRPDSDFSSEKYREMVRAFLQKQVSGLRSADQRRVSGTWDACACRHVCAGWTDSLLHPKIELAQCPSVHRCVSRQVDAVRAARKRLGLPANERGEYALERLVSPGEARRGVGWQGLAGLVQGVARTGRGGRLRSICSGCFSCPL